MLFEMTKNKNVSLPSSKLIYSGLVNGVSRSTDVVLTADRIR